jgi:hypothetical protein
MRIFFCNICGKKQIVVGDMSSNWEEVVKRDIYFCLECLSKKDSEIGQLKKNPVEESNNS